MRSILGSALFACALAGATPGLAQQEPGMGPVAASCGDDIAKFCVGKEHGQGAIRDCLEANETKVTAACRKALETTGWGRKKQ